MSLPRPKITPYIVIEKLRRCLDSIYPWIPLETRIDIVYNLDDKTSRTTVNFDERPNVNLNELVKNDENIETAIIRFGYKSGYLEFEFHYKPATLLSSSYWMREIVKSRDSDVTKQLEHLLVNGKTKVRTQQELSDLLDSLLPERVVVR